VDELDKMMSREIKLIYVAFVYACVKTQNFAFCDKKGWKNVCLKRDENMHLTSLWKETITVRPIQLSDCSHYVPAFSPPSTMQKVVPTSILH